MQRKPTVFFIDDDVLARNRIAMLLAYASLPCMTYESAEHYLAELDSEAPGVLVVNLCLPDLKGMELVEHLRAQNQFLPIIVVSAFGTIQVAVHAMKLGVVEFLEKPLDATLLIAAIRVAIDLDARQRARAARHELLEKRLATLSNREKEVLDLVVLGRPSKLIADELGISIKTVENHRSHIMSKIGAANAPDLVRMSILAHWGSSPDVDLGEEPDWLEPTGALAPRSDVCRTMRPPDPGVRSVRPHAGTRLQSVQSRD